MNEINKSFAIEILILSTHFFTNKLLVLIIIHNKIIHKYQNKVIEKLYVCNNGKIIFLRSFIIFFFFV